MQAPYCKDLLELLQGKLPPDNTDIVDCLNDLAYVDFDAWPVSLAPHSPNIDCMCENYFSAKWLLWLLLLRW